MKSATLYRPTRAVYIDCPDCGTHVKKVPNSVGGTVMLEVDGEDQFLRVHNAQNCFSVLHQRDQDLRAELRALSYADDENEGL